MRQKKPAWSARRWRTRFGGRTVNTDMLECEEIEGHVNEQDGADVESGRNLPAGR